MARLQKFYRKERIARVSFARRTGNWPKDTGERFLLPLLALPREEGKSGSLIGLHLLMPPPFSSDTLAHKQHFHFFPRLDSRKEQNKSFRITQTNKSPLWDLVFRLLPADPSGGGSKRK